MKKQPEITQQTQNNIITAFCCLYEKKPIEQIHVKDVIAAAGYNRSTFYEYFTDIYDLLAHIEDDVIQFIKAGTKNGTHNQSDLLRLLPEKEDYLKVLLGPYGGMRFQDRLRVEFMQEVKPTYNGSRMEIYLSEFHIAVSLSMYRLWLSRKDMTLNELSALIDQLYTSGTSGIL